MTRQVCERLAKENSALGYFLETKMGMSVAGIRPEESLWRICLVFG